MEKVENRYLEMVEGDYTADFSFAYLHSIRRTIYRGEWRIEDYASYRNKYQTDEVMDDQIVRYAIEGELTAETVKKILAMEVFRASFEDIDRDADRIVKHAYRNLDLESRLANSPMTIEMFLAGFYRNLGAYLVGRVTFDNKRYRPFIIALLNGDHGSYVDALINLCA